MIIISIPNNNKKAQHPYYFKERLFYTGVDVLDHNGGIGADLVLNYSEPSKVTRTALTTFSIKKKLPVGGGGFRLKDEEDPIQQIKDAIQEFNSLERRDSNSSNSTKQEGDQQ